MSVYVPPDWRPHVHRAMQERAEKTMPEIQHTTAVTWAARAIAAYIAYDRNGDVRDLLDAEEYRHEALEHGSLADSGLCATINETLDQVRTSLSRPH